MPPQDVSPLEGGTASVAAVRTVSIVGGPMALEVFSPLVTFKTDRTIMKFLVFQRGRHLPSRVDVEVAGGSHREYRRNCGGRNA
jgi:hypothetical protein